MTRSAQPPIRKHDLWAHQLDAYGFARHKPASLIGAGMGTGKTCVAVTLADNWESRRILVLCPTTVRGVWKREVARHAARDYNVVILDKGSVRKRTEQAAAAMADPRPTMIVVNYEAAWREPFREWALSQRWSLTILDESHRAQKMSRTALLCNDLRTVSARRLCLTGTPLTQGPMSVWAQCRFLDPSVFGHDRDAFLWRYENRFAVGARKALLRLNQHLRWYYDNPDLEVKVDEKYLEGTINTEEYLQRLSRVCIRIENAVLDLPPLTIEKRTFSLSGRARRLYDAIREGRTHEIETGRWPIDRLSYSTTMRLQQLTSGWLPDDSGEPQEVDAGKRECLQDILSEAGGEPVVVFTRFVHDLDICRQAAEKQGLLYGEVSQRRKDGIDDMATMTKGLQVVGVQEQAGGAGIDLSDARLMVDYSPSWSLTNYDQKLARVRRPPQTLPVTLYSLIGEGTIDEEIHRALTARSGVIRHVWHGLETTSTQALSP